MAGFPGSADWARKLNILKQQGRTPEEIGRLTGFSPSTISNWQGSAGGDTGMESPASSYRQMNIMQPGQGFGLFQQTPTERVPTNAFFQGGIPHVPFTPPTTSSSFAPTSGFGTWGGSAFGGGDVQASGTMDIIKQFGEQMQKLTDIVKQSTESQAKYRQSLDSMQSDSSFNQVSSRSALSPSGAAQSLTRPLLGGNTPAFDANAWMGGDLGPPMPPVPPGGFPDSDTGGYWGRRPRSVANPAMAFGRSTATQGDSILSQMYPDEPEQQGMLGRIGSAFSNVQLDPQKLSGALWRSSLLSSFLIAPQMRAMGDYQESYQQQQQQQLQTGGVNYSDLMAGTYGQMQRGQAMRSQAYYGFGEQVYSAYGGAFNSMSGPSGNALGAAFGVLGPAAGVGMVGGAMLGALGITGAGLPLALGAGAIGAVGYANSASQNYGAMSAFSGQANVNPNEPFSMGMARVLGAGFQNPEGLIGTAVQGARQLTGQMSDEEYKKFQNMPLYNELATQYSTGQTNRSQLEAMMTPGSEFDRLSGYRVTGGLGFSTASVMGGGQKLYQEQMSAQGIPIEQSTQNQRFFGQYVAGRVPTPQESTQITGLLSSVNDPEGLMSSLAGARGINPFNREAMGGLMSDVLGAGYNDITAGAKTYSAQMVTPLNTARLMAGLPRLSEDYFSAEADPDANLAERQLGFGETAMRSSNPRVFDALINWRGQIGAASATGDYARAGQLQSGMRSAMSTTERYMAYGSSFEAATGFTNNISGLSIEQQSQMFAASSGDPYAIGALGRATGNANMQMVDPAWQRQYQFNFAQQQRNQGYTLQTGFSPGTAQFNAQGQAIGGDLSTLAGAFASEGLSFNPGNGMGGYQVADRMTQINREQQMYNLNQQGRYQGIQQAQFDVSGRQFYEQWNLNSDYLNANTSYNRANMNINRQQQVAKTQWGEEDLEYNRNQFDVQFGWQQQDFDRNIRYSRGRERLDMIRERDRSVIQHSMQAGQMDKTEDRFAQQKEWDTERFEREKSHFEMSAKYQRENMDMQKRHFEESRQFQQEQLQMQQEAHQKQVSWATELHTLEDQNRLLTRQAAELQFQQATSYAEIMNATGQTVDSIRSSTELLAEAAVTLRQNVEAIQSPTAASSSPSNSLLPPEVVQYLKQIANNPAVVNAQINVSPNTQNVPVREITNQAYSRTRNSR